MTIRNPIEWATDQFKLAGWAIGSASRAGIGAERDLEVALPEVHRIGLDDLKEALAAEGHARTVCNAFTQSSCAFNACTSAGLALAVGCLPLYSRSALAFMILQELP
jgi:hypothetical protein